MKVLKSYEAKVPERTRILPQWLIDLADGDTETSRNRCPRERNKKIKSGRSNELVTCHDKDERPEGNSMKCSTRGEPNNGSMSSIKIEKNYRPEEISIQTGPDCLKGGIGKVNVDEIKQEPTTLSCMKEKYDSDETEDELDLNTNVSNNINVEDSAKAFHNVTPTCVDTKCFEEGVRNVNKDVVKQEPITLSYVKEKYDSDETEDELDLNTNVSNGIDVEDSAKEFHNVTPTCVDTKCFEEGVRNINKDVKKQEPTTLSYVKEIYDSDETDDELDLNTSVANSSNIEVATCNVTSTCASTECLERDIININPDVLEQEPTTLSCVKEKCDIAETADERDLNTSMSKSNPVPDSTCNDKSLNLTSTSTCMDVNIVSSVISPSATSDEDNGTGISKNVNKTDNAQSPSNQNATIQILRTKCKYGTSCYRKNTQHRQNFSHPEDDDYTAVDNRPECEYGLSCYRKNPLHRQQYKHTKKVQKPRQAKRPRKKLKNDESDDDDDEYDLDDPFIDNGSSDDYEPSSNESEMDASEEEEANSDSDLQAKETKKLKRKQRH